VSNGIAVLPLSPADDDLRYRVARSIYGHPLFWVHAQMPARPIHIVVECGRVTLTGAVDSERHRWLASSLARVNGCLGVINRVKVEQQPGSAGTGLN
jgi:osmotically-inducible protein OsmY